MIDALFMCDCFIVCSCFNMHFFFGPTHAVGNRIQFKWVESHLILNTISSYAQMVCQYPENTFHYLVHVKKNGLRQEWTVDRLKLLEYLLCVNRLSDFSYVLTCSWQSWGLVLATKRWLVSDRIHQVLAWGLAKTIRTHKILSSTK